MISVIVPVYNSEQYLDKCMKSILNSEFDNIEILLIDDGSPNGFLCDQYADIDKRVRVIRHEVNKGISAARNEGVRQSVAPYISFVDSDDWINSSMLSDIYQLAVKHDADIVSCGTTEYINKKPRNMPVPTENLNSTEIIFEGKQVFEKSLLSDPMASHTAWGKLYKRSIFEGISYPEGRVYEDAATTYKLYYKSSKVVHSEKKLYNYRINSTGISNSGFKPDSMDKLKASDEILEFVDINCAESLYHAKCFKIVTVLRLAADFTSDVIKTYPQQYKVVRQFLIDPTNIKNPFLSNRHRMLLIFYRFCRPIFMVIWQRRLKGARK